MTFHAMTFGEVMGRIAPPGFQRFVQCLPGPIEMTFAGAEANVAVSLSLLGARASFVTALPGNPLGDACIKALRGLGVDTSHIVRTSAGRLGLYFIETGANQRGGNVIYDRDGSSVMLAEPTLYDWPSLLSGVDWFHVTGITPSLSERATAATLQAVRAARAAGVTVSCDLNFRKKLWRWRPGVRPRDLAEETMRQVLQSVDLLIANEEDAADVLGIHAASTDVESGRLNVAGYREVAREIVKQFANIRRVAFTLRESISASHNNWGGMLYDAATDTAHYAPTDGSDNYRPYEIRNIVDRVGGGDAFAAGLIFALNTEGLSAPDRAIRFAVAASCLKHSVPGDFNYVTRAEVEALMEGPGTGRVQR
jgi:2-dehydro-3-deoxygluconokinase